MKKTFLALIAFMTMGLCGHSAHAQTQELPAPAAGMKQAVFAGGCFWCIVHPFDRLEGVSDVLSGYTGGQVPNVTYEQIGKGDTGHREAVVVIYDPKKVSYQTLLDIFWRNIDPLDAKGQFCDKGFGYTSAIYTSDPAEKKMAADSIKVVEEKLGQKIATVVDPAAPFYIAEDYHQYYYRENPIRYNYYRGRCGRDARLDEVWGDEAGGKNFGVSKPDAKH